LGADPAAMPSYRLRAGKKTVVKIPENLTRPE
jgi:hypothetical protein